MYNFGAGQKTVGASAPAAPISSAPLLITEEDVWNYNLNDLNNNI